MQLTDAEVRAIVSGMTDPSTFQASGIRVAGNKFMCLQAESDHVFGKKGVRLPYFDPLLSIVELIGYSE